MGFFSKLFGRGGDSRHIGIQTGGSRPRSSRAVDFDSAMSVSAFWASTRLLTEAVAAMPINCYRINEETNIKEKAAEYDLWRLLNYRPNRYQTRTEFIEQIMLNLVTRGNAYCAIEKTSRGRITALTPLPSSQMEPELLRDGTMVYEYTDAESNVRVFAQESIWHIKLFGNGLVGLSPIKYASQALSTSQSLDDRMDTLSANGGKSTGVLMVDQVLDDEQRENIRESFADLERGNDEQLFVLEAGMKYQQTNLSPQDMQLIENRRFEVEDIARFMGVPSVLINDTAASTTWGSGIQQIKEGFYQLNLKPYLERIESSIKRHLMPQSDWESFSIEFDFDSLLRADKATRMESLQKGINAGIYTPNEARSSEGLPEKAGGNEIYLNGSLVPAGTSNRPQNQAIMNEASDGD